MSSASGQVVSKVAATHVTTDSAVITWTTSLPASTLVRYGAFHDHDRTIVGDPVPVRSHAITLNGLSANTLYEVQVVVGSAISSSLRFATVATAPVRNDIDIHVTGLSSTGAGTRLADGDGSNPGTTYPFATISTDTAAATGYSDPSKFSAAGAAALGPAISNVSTGNVTASSATISWTTDVPGSSVVNYGTTASYGFSVVDSTLTKSHALTLTGLASGTRYVFQVVSANAAGVSTLGAELSGFTIWAWGDSQTAGGNDGTGINYPAILAATLAATVYNQGVGGDASTQIAQRMLATPAAFRVGNCNVFWANNGSQINLIQPDMASMVNALDTPKCFLVLSTINHVDPIGSPNYNAVISLNTALASQYGGNYLDIRKILVEAYNPSLPMDVADHNADIMPASLRAVQRKGTITSGSMDSSACLFSVSNGTQGPGTVLIVDSETILVNAMSNPSTVTDCVRGYNRSAAASHVANAGYSTIDGTHVGYNGLAIVAAQVAALFRSQPWPLCTGTAGVTCPAPLNFTTAASNTASPVITSVTATNITSNAAVINWTTDQPATAQVNYGVVTPRTATFTTAQAVQLTGLTPGTTYNFQVISANSSGASTISATYTFTTTASASATPPAVGYLAFWGVNNTGVTISWSTDVISNTIVAYGTSPALGQLYSGSTSTVSHGAVLTGLLPGTTYYFVAQSTGTNGATGYSATYNFTTTGVATVNPGFTLSATAATVAAGSSGTSTVTVTPLNGFNAAVSLAASAWPAGITGTFGSSLVSINVAAGVAPGAYTLTLKGTGGAVSKSTSIALTVTAAPGGGGAATANFTGLDAQTQGTWSGVYGSDGFLIANSASSLPAYASVGFDGALTFTWASLTSDGRALQSARGAAARIASSYYAATPAGFGINVNFNDGAAHQVALYLLDWDTASRAATITIFDSGSGALLDTRNVSGFHNGVYEVWNIKGAVTIHVTGAAGNAVASGLFFAPATGVTGPPPSFTLSATAAAANAGSAGTSVVTITPANNFNSAVTLAANNWPAGITGMFGTNPATGSSSVTIGVAGSVAPGAYTLGVTGAGGALSASTAIALTVSAASAGRGSSGSFAGQDTTTGGAWTSRYGAAGFTIANAASVQAPYATMGFTNALTYTWAAQTPEARAPRSARGATTGIASAFTQYSGQAFSINVAITDGNTHFISLYLLDWDGVSRSQTITILDPVSNAVLDTRTFSGFHDGLYASWNIGGNVTIRVSPEAYSSAVVSGVFLN